MNDLLNLTKNILLEYKLEWSDINKFGNGQIIDNLVNQNNNDNINKKDQSNSLINEIEVEVSNQNNS